MRQSDNEARINILRRTAKEVKSYRVAMKILAACAACLATLIALIYVCAALYENSGSFTVNLNKAEMTEYGLTLSETEDMRYKTSHLNANIVENMTNIDGAVDIPPNVDNYDGEHNGDNYIAYTFYAQNAGKHTVDYEYSLELSNITKGLDEAIRVRLYIDGEAVTYAKKAADGNPEPGTSPFEGTMKVTSGTVTDFEVGEKTKYTVVIWIEGPDPECLDWAIGGEIKIDMRMSIVD